MPPRSMKKKQRKVSTRMPLIPQRVIKEADVLLGRGKATFKNPGNIAYRALVDTRLELYFKGERSEKGAIVLETISAIKARGSRFLKKKGTFWQEVNIRTAREKVGHSIRDTSKASVRFKYQDDMHQLFNEKSNFGEILEYVRDNYKSIRYQISNGESAKSNKGPEQEDSEEKVAVISPNNGDSSISSDSVLEVEDEMLEIEDSPLIAGLMRPESKPMCFGRRRSSRKRDSLVRAFISKLDTEAEQLAKQESMESLQESNNALHLKSIANIDEWIGRDSVESESQHSDDEWSEFLVALAARG